MVEVCVGDGGGVCVGIVEVCVGIVEVCVGMVEVCVWDSGSV